MTRNNATKPAAPALPSDTPFETAIAELEEIVQNMESGRLSLEESILAYRRGSELFQHCQKQLGEAEHRIQVFENGRVHDADLAGEIGR